MQKDDNSRRSVSAYRTFLHLPSSLSESIRKTLEPFGGCITPLIHQFVNSSNSTSPEPSVSIATMASCSCRFVILSTKKRDETLIFTATAAD